MTQWGVGLSEKHSKAKYCKHRHPPIQDPHAHVHQILGSRIHTRTETHPNPGSRIHTHANLLYLQRIHPSPGSRIHTHPSPGSRIHVHPIQDPGSTYTPVQDPGSIYIHKETKPNAGSSCFQLRLGSRSRYKALPTGWPAASSPAAAAGTA